MLCLTEIVVTSCVKKIGAPNKTVAISASLSGSFLEVYSTSLHLNLAPAQDCTGLDVVIGRALVGVVGIIERQAIMKG